MSAHLRHRDLRALPVLAYGGHVGLQGQHDARIRFPHRDDAAGLADAVELLEHDDRVFDMDDERMGVHDIEAVICERLQVRRVSNGEC